MKKIFLSACLLSLFMAHAHAQETYENTKLIDNDLNGTARYVGMGGAMDLVQGAKRVIVIMEHVSKYGESKIKKECTLPLTGKKVVHRLITELAVFDFTEKGMVLIELASSVSVEEIRAKTEADFLVSENLIKYA